jgi:hypothetical protein
MYKLEFIIGKVYYHIEEKLRIRAAKVKLPVPLLIHIEIPIEL